MNKIPKKVVKFKFEEYGNLKSNKKPPHPRLLGYNSFNLSGDNCSFTDLTMLYRAIADKAKKIENSILEGEKDGSVHFSEYTTFEFLENIISKMQKIENIDNYEYYTIKTK